MIIVKHSYPIYDYIYGGSALKNNFLSNSELYKSHVILVFVFFFHL